MHVEGSDLHQLTTDPEGESSELPAFSPSGDWLTYTHIPPSGASSDWKLKVSESDQTPLAASPADEYSDWIALNEACVELRRRTPAVRAPA